MKHIFISHSSKNRIVASRIAKALTDEGFKTWYYEDPPPGKASADYLDRLYNAIQESLAFILVISESSIQSNEVNRELEQAHKQRKQIIPVLYGMTESRSEKKMKQYKRLNWLQILGATIRTNYSPRSLSEICERCRALKSGGEYDRELEGFLQAKGFLTEERIRDDLFLTKRYIGNFPFFFWFFCPAEPIKLDDVQSLLKEMERWPDSKAWIISEQPMDFNARKILDKRQGSIQVATIAKFYRAILKYDDYLDGLIKNAAQDIKNYWVDLHCQYGGNGRFNLEEYVDLWLKDPKSRLLALLGEYGTGKSWFCRYFASALAERHLKSPDDHRIPILIPLNGWAKVQSMQKHITSFLTDEAGIDVGDYEAFMHLNRHGRLLLIFDGFDEMEQRVRPDVAAKNLREVIGTIAGKSKALLTSRPPFLDESEISRSISAVDDNYRRLPLLLFEQTQIKDALKKMVKGKKWEEGWRQIQQNEKLKDMAQRPIMIRLISEVLPTEIKAIDSVDLFRCYIMDGWIKKAGRNNASLLERRTDVLFFLRDAAYEMFSSAGTISQERFNELANEKFNSIELTDALGQLFIPDMRTGTYAFPHSIFMEYLVAEKIADELGRENGQALLDVKITNNIAGFLKEITYSNNSTWPGILEALFLAQRGEPIDSLTQFLAELGRSSAGGEVDSEAGNPVLPLLEGLNKTQREVEDISPQILAALGREEYLNHPKARELSAGSESARQLWLGLWESSNIDSESALRELMGAINNDDEKADLRLFAVEVIEKRHGDKELQALIDVTRSDKLPVQIRQQAIISLGRIDSPYALNSLVEILLNYQDVDTSLWASAISALSLASDSSIADEIETRVIPKAQTDVFVLRQLRDVVRTITDNAHKSAGRAGSDSGVSQ